MTSTAPVLRDYQHEALDAIEAFAAGGGHRGLVVLPTGTGKTVIFAEALRRRGGRSLVLAHRDELLGQAAHKLAEAGIAEVGKVAAKADDMAAQIVLASVQTVSRDRRLTRLVGTGMFSTVVVDEAHHVVAASYRKVLDALGAFEEGGPLTLGFTATADRGDRKGLGAVFEKVVYSRSMLPMIETGYLVDLRGLSVGLDIDWRQVRTTGGDYNVGDLAHSLTTARAPEHVVEAYRRHGERRKALAFFPSVALAAETAERFRAAGVRSEVIDGTMSPDERAPILRRLRSGETAVVCNCAVLTEGFDEPSVEAILLARPTRSRALYVQQLGRGTRPYPGKTDCLVVDFVGATARHDLVTFPSLFGLPAELLDKGQHSLTEAVEAHEERERRRVQGAVVARRIDLFRRRPMHWVKIDPRHFVLSIEAGAMHLVAEDEQAERWRVVEAQRGHRPETLASGLDLGYAQGRAEDRVRELGAPHLASARASWRRRPASDKQRRYLAGLGIAAADDPALTAGKASDLITAATARKLRVPA
ncbi:MAG: DEAD/DEAH box helicase [Actinomycetota bacterium]|nr:DEAD/DEAH box helicase [Actinomycetota bacterium]